MRFRPCIWGCLALGGECEYGVPYAVRKANPYFHFLEITISSHIARNTSSLPESSFLRSVMVSDTKPSVAIYQSSGLNFDFNREKILDWV